MFPRNFALPSRATAAALLAPWLFAIGCGSDTPVPDADPATLRTLGANQGQVIGFADDDHEAHVWKGLRFARPPVGDLRWRAPQPPEPVEGVREALESGAECVQYDIENPSEIKGDEDCLFLDVYAPRFAADAVPTAAERRPVMVWIHGGGNSIGSAVVYDASRLAAENDVIVVAIQYRLGLLGWLSHPALRATAQSRDDASGNFGTLDTIRALEWVHDHAAAFGGDPDNVTVFGESAGGIDVFALLLSPRAKGLFHRAVAQSGVLMTVTRAQAENAVDATTPDVAGMPGSSTEVLLAHLVADGRADDREAAKPVLAAMSPAEIEAYLRAKKAKDLLSIFEAENMGGMYFVPQLIRDGRVIVDADPEVALASPLLHNAVPTLVGTNREETKLFALFDSPYVRYIFGMPVGLSDADAFDLDGEYGGLSWKSNGADVPAEAMISSGRRDVFGYRFDWDEEGELLWLELDRMLGASHGIELLFVFGFTDLGRWTDNVYADLESAEELSRRMRSYWTHFARTGDPGRGQGGDLPLWQPWGPGPASPKYLVLDSDAGGGLRMDDAILDAAGVLREIANEGRFETTQQRCETLRDIVQFSPVYTAADYASFAGGACSNLPLEERTPLGGF